MIVVIIPQGGGKKAMCSMGCAVPGWWRWSGA